MSQPLLRRMRRNRSSHAIRRLVAETSVGRDDLIWPLFHHGGSGAETISSMPNVFRHDLDGLKKQAQRACDLGIPAIALFPCIETSLKDATGSHACAESNILFRAVREIKKELPQLLLIADIALDPYTSHGHDGILNPIGNKILNDQTVEALCRLSLAAANAGADIVAPSDMMDGRIKAIRQTLDAEGHQDVLILSYAAKYASAYYGPFRDAVGSKTVDAPLDKSTYQMNPANVREARLETKLDEEEGADILMIKPAGLYLDIIHAVREQTLLPLAAYQVSGEYAQIHAAAKLGWLDYEKTRNESILAIKRAGADMILTYFAPEIAANL
ncbi:MAG: porphobilinogen synthase [Chthoniobacterales bacterium]